MSFPIYSDYFVVWQAFRDRKVTLCYSNDILNEYYEILSRYYSVSVAELVLEEILLSSNAEPVAIFYNWNLITADPDDNKFVDCALNSGSDYIIANDKHFNALKEISFPNIEVLDIDSFKQVLLANS